MMRGIRATRIGRRAAARGAAGAIAGQAGPTRIGTGRIPAGPHPTRIEAGAIPAEPHPTPIETGSVPAEPHPTRIEAASRRLAFEIFGRIRAGSLTVHEPGGIHTFGSGEPSGLIDVHSPAAWPLLLRGSRGLAEGYARGYWDSPDLASLIRVGARNSSAFDMFRRRIRPLLAPVQIAAGTFRSNDRRSSRKQIAAHYDLGNELYELMLDPTMMYSCAWFAREDMTLDEASLAKLDLVCERLDLRPDDHLLEIGTGWGGLAIHAARTRGCRVTTTTISREQHELAVERVRAAGLGDRVTVLLQDYRDLRGRYDKLVSIEMIEAVGWRNFGVFFRRCSELLEGDGAMLLQAITIDDRAYEVEKTSHTFINTYIFPNGCLPSIEVIARCVAEETDMRLVGLQDLTPSYVSTLRAWRANFEAHTERLEELGYDERFRRLWRLYLTWSEAGFTERRIGDVQVLLAKPGYRSEGSLLNIREDTASSTNAGPRDASLASAVLPPGPRIESSRSTAATMREAHSAGVTSSQSDVSM
jgi:cyclopropane-fatty-acyl-phospholipid synthase